MTETLIITVVLFSSIAVLVVVEMMRGVRLSKEVAKRDEAVRRLQSDVHALCAGAINMSNYMTSLEQRLRRLTERQDQSELRDPAQQPYTHANRLIQQGADIRTLMEQCGLSQGEAELLMRVNRAQQRKAVAS